MLREKDGEESEKDFAPVLDQQVLFQGLLSRRNENRKVEDFRLLGDSDGCLGYICYNFDANVLHYTQPCKDMSNYIPCELCLPTVSIVCRTSDLYSAPVWRQHKVRNSDWFD